MPLALAACGGGSSQKPKPVAVSKRVHGPRFSFTTPREWAVTRSPTSVLAAPVSGGDLLVGTYFFATVKPYRPSLWPAAARELDRRAQQLAKQLKARVASRATVRVAGANARQYVFVYGTRTAKLTFFYDDRREYELYCRWATRAREPAACAALRRSFRLTRS